VSLEVADDLIGANNGRFTASFDGGRARVRDGGAAAVRIDVRSLAALWSGFWTPSQLRAVGAVEGPDDALGTLGAAFAGATPAMNDMF
jgi:predicted acetyltransferase